MMALRRLLDRLTDAFTWIAGLLAFVMMVHVTVDVAGRNLFNAPLVGTIEIVSAYYMAPLAFLPLAVITRERGHIIVELFTGWMKRGPRVLLDAFVAVLTLIYVSLFTWQAFLIAWEMTEVREAREAGVGLVRVWPARWVVPIGFLLMAIYLIVYIRKDINAVRTGNFEDETNLGDIGEVEDEENRR